MLYFQHRRPFSSSSVKTLFFMSKYWYSLPAAEQSVHNTYKHSWANFSDVIVLSDDLLTIFQCGGGHLSGGGPRARAVAGLHHHSILGELLQVVQHQVLCIISGGLHTNHTELVVSTRAVLSVPHLIAPNGSVLEVLLGCLRKSQGVFWKQQRCWITSNLGSAYNSKVFNPRSMVEVFI